MIIFHKYIMAWVERSSYLFFFLYCSAFGDYVQSLPDFNFQVLRLHLDYAETHQEKSEPQISTATAEKSGFITPGTGIFAGAVVLTSIGVLVYLKRANV